METARAIVEAHCKKVSASPETATDEQLPSLARAFARLLYTILSADNRQ